jgi:hypothetical protein
VTGCLGVGQQAQIPLRCASPLDVWLHFWRRPSPFAGLMAYGERSDSAVGAAGSAPDRPRPLTTPFAISQLGQLKPRLIGAVSQVFDPSAQQHREPGARVRAALPDRVRRLKDERHPPALVGARRRATDDGAHRARQCAGAGAVGRIHRRRPAVGELDRRRRRSEYSQSSATQTEPAAARCSSSSQPGSGAPDQRGARGRQLAGARHQLACSESGATAAWATIVDPPVRITGARRVSHRQPAQRGWSSGRPPRPQCPLGTGVEL